MSEELEAIHKIKLSVTETAEPGQLFECGDDEVDYLVRTGAAKFPTDKEFSDDGSYSPLDDFIVTQEILVEAIGNLEPEDSEHYTKGGLPECKAIADQIELMYDDAVDVTVTADERNVAFEIFKAQ